MPETSASTGTSEIIDRRALLWAGAAGAGLGAIGGLGIPTGTAGAFAKRPVILSRWRCTSTPASARVSPAWMRISIRRVDSALTWCGGPTTTSARWRTAFAPPSASTARTSLTITGTSSGKPSSGPLASGDRSFVDAARSIPTRMAARCRSSPPRSPDPAWAIYTLQARSQNALYSTSYSDTTLELDIYPQQLGADARVVVEILSSYRPATAGRPAGQYRIQYRLGDSVGIRPRSDGLVGVVGLRCAADRRLAPARLDPARGSRRLWPDTVAADASLLAAESRL